MPPHPMTFPAFEAAFPEVVAALRAANQSAASGMDKGLLELVKVRVSQINGCGFCLQLHLNWARAAGVSQERLDRVVVWREAPGFTAQERAALAWAEALSLPAAAGPAQAPEDLHRQFTEEQVRRLTIAVAVINAWNRIAGPLGFPPPPAA